MPVYGQLVTNLCKCQTVPTPHEAWLVTYDVIAGTFFICGAPEDSEDFTSLTDEQAAYWLKRFAKPEFFVSVNGKLICVPVEEARA